MNQQRYAVNSIFMCAINSWCLLCYGVSHVMVLACTMVSAHFLVLACVMVLTRDEWGGKDKVKQARRAEGPPEVNF